jgi:hypothetical protein
MRQAMPRDLFKDHMSREAAILAAVQTFFTLDARRIERNAQ